VTTLQAQAHPRRFYAGDQGAAKLTSNRHQDYTAFHQTLDADAFKEAAVAQSSNGRSGSRTIQRSARWLAMMVLATF
jgi:hypothetical protein